MRRCRSSLQVYGRTSFGELRDTQPDDASSRGVSEIEALTPPGAATEANEAGARNGDMPGAAEQNIGAGAAAGTRPVGAASEPARITRGRRRDTYLRRLLALADLLALTGSTALAVLPFGSDTVRPEIVVLPILFLVGMKLLGLYDPSSVGLWEAMNLRHDFEAFFGATKTRRLRLRGVSWDTASATAHVKGAATLVAEYHDETGRAERQVSLEMDVVLKNGQPRIARLSLFPHER